MNFLEILPFSLLENLDINTLIQLVNTISRNSPVIIIRERYPRLSRVKKCAPKKVITKEDSLESIVAGKYEKKVLCIFNLT